MPRPKVHPDRRELAEVESTESYAPRDRVWVFREGEWDPAVIYEASGFAATVICRAASARGNEIEIRTARFLARRDSIVPAIDTLTYV
ncbi:hypothetical protein QEZ54_27605 [Catellatospora sp. KI3]|uniref:hypothetical protein n=1 Tax=Catellatospora sp. KI3 TaxID=3041620 RepID=UPI002482F3C8|nr:hypothetical protein [Catellatospora sp. KI3]MDI1464742.1 hypothetical protein [Catellatospora sp. KI3]